MNLPYLWCLSVKSASKAAGTWNEREETRAHRKTPYHISAERRAVRRARGRREGPAPSRPRGAEGTWEGGQRAGVGGGAVADAGHQAEAEDLLQEPPAAAAATARLAALHPLSGAAAAIRRLLCRPPPSARLSQWEARLVTGGALRQPPLASEAAEQPGPRPHPRAAMGTAVGRKECRETPGHGSRLGGRGWRGALARWLTSPHCSRCSAQPRRRSHGAPRKGALGNGRRRSGRRRGRA